MIDLNEVIDGLEYVNDCIDKNIIIQKQKKSFIQMYWNMKILKNLMI